MIGRILGKVRDMLAEMPMVRTALIIFGVFYMFKNSSIYSKQKEEGILEGKYSASPEQVEYKNLQARNGIILTTVLLVIYITLRCFNERNTPDLNQKQAVEEEEEEEVWKNSDDEKEEIGNKEK